DRVTHVTRGRPMVEFPCLNRHNGGFGRVDVRCRSLVLACLIIVPGSACLYGQQSSIGGPSSGFAFDQSARVLRQIRGIPGASTLGEPVDFGLSLAAAYVSPRLDSALVVAADGTLHLFRLAGGVPAEYRLEG